MAYEVHLDVFSGPFDLLLQLITAQQVDVYEVSLADLVDAFCAEIAEVRALDLERATEFLLIAATLVELKCRRLLPEQEDPELDDELSLYAARDYLLARLVECRMFTDVGRVLRDLEASASHAHPRRTGPDERYANLEPDLLAGVSGALLATLAGSALAPRPRPTVDSAHVHDEEVSVQEVLKELVAHLPSAGPTTLRALTVGASPARVVAFFLSLLELYKEALVELTQHEHFGELTVCWSGNDSAAAIVADSYDDVSVLL